MTWTLGPTLFLGLGGAGCGTIARVKQLLEMEYLGTEFSQRLPMVQYLLLDTWPLRNADFDIGLIDPDEYFYLGGFNAAAEIKTLLASSEDVRAWWDTNYQPFDEQVDEGAGRVRQLGRLCLYRHRLAVNIRLTEKLRQTKLAAQQWMKEGDSESCDVYVATGSCGGTGSGTFLDMMFLVRAACREVFGETPPHVTVLQFLPYLWIDLGRKRSLVLEQAYKANAEAFFREMEYFLAHPHKMNDLCMNARERQESKLARLESWRPFDVAYLIDRQIEANVGDFDNKEDLIAYAGRALAQLVVAPDRKAHAEGWDNIKGELRKIDNLFRRPRAFSALGFASLEYPREIIYAYLRHRFAHDILNDGLLGQGAWIQDEVKKQVSPTEGGLPHEIGLRYLQEFESKCASARDLAAQVPGMDAFKNDDGRLDRGRVSPGAMRSAYEEAERWIAEAERRILAAYEEWHGRALDSIWATVSTLTNTTRSLYLTKSILYETDNYLSERIRQWHRDVSADGALGGRIAAFTGKMERLRSDVTAELEKSRFARLFTGDDTARKLETFLEELQDFTRTSIEMLIVKAKIQFLERLAGKLVGTSASVEYTRGGVRNIVEKGILDEAREAIDEIILKLQLMAGEEANNMTLDKYLRRRGAEVTTRYFPEIGSVEELRESGDVDGIYREVVDLPAELNQIMNRWNDPRRVPEEHRLWSYKERDYPHEVLTRLLHERAGELFVARIRRSVLDAVREAERRGMTTVKQELAGLARLSRVLLSHEIARMHERDRGNVYNIWTFSAPTEGLQDQLGLADPEKLRFVPGPQERISLLHCRHAFPFYTVNGLEALRAGYLSAQRDANREPLHLHRQWISPRGAQPGGELLAPLFSRVHVRSESRVLFAAGLFTQYVIRQNPDKMRESLFETLVGFVTIEPRGVIRAFADGYEFTGFEVDDRSTRIRQKPSESVFLGVTRNDAIWEFDLKLHLHDRIKHFLMLFEQVMRKDGATFQRLAQEFYLKLEKLFEAAQDEEKEQLNLLAMAFHQYAFAKPREEGEFVA